jgi:hypothetical protein
MAMSDNGRSVTNKCNTAWWWLKGQTYRWNKILYTKTTNVFYRWNTTHMRVCTELQIYKYGPRDMQRDILKDD